jgi:uncharacterized protein (TIGR00255 family)
VLLSMTGFGEAHAERDGLTVSVEVRTVNNRYLKLSTRTSEGYGALEPQIEAAVRTKIRRGTVQVSVRVDRARSADDYRIDAEVLGSYRRQIEQLALLWQQGRSVPLESFLPLPGVVIECNSAARDVDDDWPVVCQALDDAIERMESMRKEEGRAMAADLKGNARSIAECLEHVQRRAPLVIEAYRARLKDRVQKALAELQVTLDPADLIREVSLFSDRSDISEEVVRLRSHLDQFDQLLDASESAGRKLDFLIQEMVREANTIGSKANDVEIARWVIEIKTAVERIREMIQNVE